MIWLKLNLILYCGLKSVTLSSSSIVYAKLLIGNFCSIAGNVTIYLGGNHNINRVTTYPFGHIHQNIFNTLVE